MKAGWQEPFRLLWFEAKDEYCACAARTDQAYPGAVLTRYLLLADRMLVDVFTVEAARPTQIDWLAHAQSDRVAPVGDRGPGAPAEPGKEDGYHHLTGGRAWAVDGPSAWDFVAGPKQRLRLWLGGDGREQVLTPAGIGYSIDSKVPCLVRRRDGRQARFVAVYDLTPEAGYVAGIRPLDAARPHVAVETRDGRWAVEFEPDGLRRARP